MLLISSYLPQNENGSVLVTSQTRSLASQLVEENDIIPIGLMDKAGAQALLHKKLGEEVDKEGIADLAGALEFMPLALVQVAAHIRHRAPRTSLLDYGGDRLRRDDEVKNSILIMWQISFDHTFYARRSAADLLSLRSFLDRQGRFPKHYESEASIEDGFEEVVLALRNYPVIAFITDADTFEMYGLVQPATRKWLEGQDQLVTWKQ
ncbi:hypothetical protein BKA66DRAFT_517051 [Pyrenochaeta sp. MPI-SDFR-AT-0127]|nr:hypothetical protein BKA66DRAFT_517051 [Pyrenochaeta sp. MPI-SDFR-AT-0127]